MGVVTDAGDGIDVEVQIDGFGAGPLSALWCIQGSAPEKDQRVVMAALTGGQYWFVIAMASAGKGGAGQRVYYTADATWTKADYPGLRAIMIRLVGGGGGGGGCTAFTSSTQCAAAGGGGGGAYAETFVLEADLGATETVQVGAGGAGASAGQNAGSAGEASFFGTFCNADQGSGGGAGNLIASPDYGNSGGNGGFGVTGDLIIDGGDGWSVVAMQAAVIRAPGGSTVWSPTRPLGRSGNGFNGASGHGYGGGGSGGANANDQSTARSGGTGANGLVIVDIIY